ncbi:unnamed protein product [Durusdinium trenchii]|uniref:Uncharacterized protein n=1 Tax=Durusdinium trenchii TaxID=1381693 RepID=A0ABP0LPZ5_9DINO
MAKIWRRERLALGPRDCQNLGEIVVFDHSDVEAADPFDPPKEEARKEAQAAAHGEEGSFEAKAAARLAEALQDGQAGRTLGEALAASFLKVWGNTPESAQRLRALAGLFGDLLWPLFVSLRLGRAFLLTH